MIRNVSKRVLRFSLSVLCINNIIYSDEIVHVDRVKVLMHLYFFNPATLYKVPIPSQESERLCIRVSGHVYVLWVMYMC